MVACSVCPTRSTSVLTLGGSQAALLKPCMGNRKSLGVLFGSPIGMKLRMVVFVGRRMQKLGARREEEGEGAWRACWVGPIGWHPGVVVTRDAKTSPKTCPGMKADMQQ